MAQLSESSQQGGYRQAQAGKSLQKHKIKTKILQQKARFSQIGKEKGKFREENAGIEELHIQPNLMTA